MRLKIVATPRLQEVLKIIKSLPIEEQRQLRDKIDAWLAMASPRTSKGTAKSHRRMKNRLDKQTGTAPQPAKPPMSDEAFQRHLLQLGLLGEIKAPITDYTPYEHRQLIDIRGKSVSEMLIEDRR
jgi:hypothetical protein